MSKDSIVVHVLLSLLGDNPCTRIGNWNDVPYVDAPSTTLLGVQAIGIHTKNMRTRNAT